MSDHKTRLQQEQLELIQKLSKLLNFLGTPAFNNLSEGNKILLMEQADVMNKYVNILKVRLELLG